MDNKAIHISPSLAPAPLVWSPASQMLKHIVIVLLKSRQMMD